MSEFKVFYSWQSDLPNATNRGFIGDALKKACQELASNPELEDSPRVDQDTQGLAGAPSIPQAIMEKIDACQAFVADVSLCFSGPNDKVAPNPNVLYELGYAVARLGWDRVILVVNEVYGRIEQLPFDLEKRRAISYNAKENETDRSAAKKSLMRQLSDGIASISLRQPTVLKRTPADEAIDAVESQSTARKARIRGFWTWLLSELHRIEPDLRTHPPEGEHLQKQVADLMAAIDSSGELVGIWSRVCDAVAMADDSEGAEAVSQGFGSLLDECDFKEGQSAPIYETMYDYWRFLGHELWTAWIGYLLREKRWEMIDAALGRTFFSKHHRGRTRDDRVTFDKFSVCVRLLDHAGKASRRVSVHADTLRARYEPAGIGATLSWSEFMDADLFLFTASEHRLDPGFGGFFNWIPWSVLFMKHQPGFLTEASRKKDAEGVKLALGCADSARIRAVIMERVPKLCTLWLPAFWNCPLSRNVVDAFDTKA